MKDLSEQSRELYLRLLSYVRPHAKVFAVAVLGMIGKCYTPSRRMMMERLC